MSNDLPNCVLCERPVREYGQACRTHGRASYALLTWRVNDETLTKERVQAVLARCIRKACLSAQLRLSAILDWADLVWDDEEAGT